MPYRHSELESGYFQAENLSHSLKVCRLYRIPAKFYDF